MYQRDDETRHERRGPDGPERIAPEERARHALTRIDRALTVAPPDLALDRDRLRAALQTPLNDAALEAQRRFALGWLDWLDGHFASAVAHLTGLEGARAAYWRTRAALLAGQTEAVAAYEQALRTFQGSPQATAWFVDLLWRGGRQERAAQVWKSLRANKRIRDCEEATLLEARALLAQGDVSQAETLLREAVLQGAVLRCERLLLLAWCGAARQKKAEVAARLEGADTTLFPAQALVAWRALARRSEKVPTWEQLRGWPLSPAVRAWVEAQHLRLTPGHETQALELLGRATCPSLTPFIRYVRAVLGQEQFGDVLSALPGAFLAPRCRLWLVLGKFCRGAATAAEALTALQQAGHIAVGLEPWRRLVELQAAATTTPEQLWQTENGKRSALRLALQRWSDAQALPVLQGWAREAVDDAPLRRALGRALLRIALRHPLDAAVMEETLSLVDDEARELTRTLLRVEAEPSRSESPTGRLWTAAVGLARGDSPADWLQGCKSGVAVALLTFQAARRQDMPALVRLLTQSEKWLEFRPGPPRFVLAALLAVPATGPWNETLARWLELWPGDIAALEPLRVQSGQRSPDAATAVAPSGADAAIWYWHQASLSLARDDAVAALAWLKRLEVGAASRAAPGNGPARLAGPTEDAGVGAASRAAPAEVRRAEPDLPVILPLLARRARAQRLALVARPDDAVPAVAAGLLVECADLLHDIPEGRALLETPDLAQAREHLAALASAVELSPRLAHHLALIFYRTARHYDAIENFDAAGLSWLRSWRCWLKAERSVEEAALLFDHLLGHHRATLEGLLARGEVAPAKRVWDTVLSALPRQLEGNDTPSATLLRTRLQSFRDDVAASFLLDTREAMRHGAIPEGWRWDYEQGLNRLRRLLSLDRDNPRLLTAVVEICADWFLDLYDVPDAARLKQEVDRYTPFALQLARKDRGGRSAAEELGQRAALSEFFKFRAFVTDDPERKRALYQEALALNPANDNVRDLLGDDR